MTEMAAEPEGGGCVEPLQLPAGGKPSVDFVKQLQQRMLDASWQGVGVLSQVVPTKLVTQILTKVSAILDAEPTLLEVGAGDQQPGQNKWACWQHGCMHCSYTVIKHRQ
jgi:hypothetical protein